MIPKISASSRLSPFLAVGLALCLAGAAEAQGFRVTGNLLHVTEPDTNALSGRWVVLHAVALDGGAPVDSVRTDGAGQFTFRVSALDTLASYLVSTEHHSIGYFSDPFRPSVDALHTVPPVVVFDTSSTTPVIQLAERHLLVHQREPDGTRRIIELFVLANRGTETRIAPTAAQPTWVGRIPDEALQFEVGLSDMSEEAILQVGNAIQVVAPIPPGEREMLVSYLLPRGASELQVPIDQSVEQLAVLLGDSTASVLSDLLTLAGVDDLDGTPLQRYEAQDVDAGTAVLLRFGREPVAPTAFLWLLVPVVAAAFVFGFVRWRTQHGTQPIAASTADPTMLATEIAALDAAYAGKQDDEYQARRAELKERLSKLLEEQG